LKASRHIYSEINQTFGSFPFSIRALGDEKKARLGIVECVKHSLVAPYDVYQEKEGKKRKKKINLFKIFLLKTFHFLRRICCTIL